MKSKFSNLELAEKFLELSDKFKNYYEKNKTVLDFTQFDVDTNECGTVACHGGFGLCILGTPEEIDDFDYSDGAFLISEYLGFKFKFELEAWAEANPKIWGSSYGDSMFSDVGYLSFGFKKDSNITLLDISNHYKKVSENLIKLGN